MSVRPAIALGALLAAGVIPCALAAQPVQATERQILLVFVRDRTTIRPVRDVVLTGRDDESRAVTDSGGRARLQVKRGVPHALEARRIGYALSRADVPATSGDTATVDVYLVLAAQELAEVTVPGERVDIAPRLAPFETRRQRRLNGSFITRADLEKWGTTRLTDALRRMPGVKIVDNLYAKFAASSRSQKPVFGGVRGALDLAPCIMRVGIDGEIKELAFQLDELSVTEIHGIEVYPGPASIPAEFGGLRKDAFCGLVMIWTRAR